MHHYPPELFAKLDAMTAALQTLTDQTSAMLAAIRAGGPQALTAVEPQPMGAGAPTEAKDPMHAVHLRYQAEKGVGLMAAPAVTLMYGRAAEFARERATKETDPDIQEDLRRYAIEADEVVQAVGEMNIKWCRAAARNVNYQYDTWFKVHTPTSEDPMSEVNHRYMTEDIAITPVDEIARLYCRAAEFAHVRALKETNPEVQQDLRRYSAKAFEVNQAAENRDVSWCSAVAKHVNQLYIAHLKARTTCRPRD